MSHTPAKPERETLATLGPKIRDESKLSEFLSSKLLPTLLSAKISNNCLLKHGLALLCQESSDIPDNTTKIAILYPPCLREFPTGIHSPVVSMVDMDSDLLVFTDDSYVSLNLDNWAGGSLTPLTRTIRVAVRGNEGEILLGLQNGNIETYRWGMRQEEGVADRMSLEDAHISYKGPDGDEVSKISIIQKENCFLATYSGGNKVYLWKCGKAAPIYRFSPTPDAPIPFIVLTDTPIPEGSYSIFVLSPEKVSFTTIVFHNKSSGGNFAIEMRDGTCVTTRKLSSLDSVCYKAKSEGVVTFNLDPYAVFFTSNIKPNEWLKEECTKRGNLVNVSLPVDFTKAEISENGAYLYLIGGNIVYTLPLAAVETQFTHAFSDQSSYLRGREVIYQQFSCLYDSTGTEKVHIPKETNISFTSNHSFYYTYDQNRKNWKLFTLPDHTELYHELNEVPLVAISEDCKRIALVLRKNIMNKNIERTSEWVTINVCLASNREKMELFLKPANLLFVFCQEETAKLISMETVPKVADLKECEKYKKITDVSGDKCDFLAILDTEIAYFSWENNKWQKTKSQPTTTYLSLQAFGQGKYCTAELEKGCNVLTLPTFAIVMTFGSSTRLCTNRESEVILSYGTERGQTDYMVCTFWDLCLGIPTYRIDLGLSTLPMNLVGKTQDLTLQSTLIIERLWRLPKTLNNPKKSLPEWVFTDSPIDNKISLVGVEYLPQYFIAVKHFSHLLTAKANTTFHPNALRLRTYSEGANILHFLVNGCKPDLVRSAFAAGARFLSSSFGTPIGVCLQFQKEKPELIYCLDELLKGLTGLSASDPTEFLIALHCLGDDFSMLLKSGSSYLPSFLGKILVPLPQELRYNELIPIYAELPLPRLRWSLKPDIARIPASWKCWLQTVYFHEYRICPIPLSLEIKQGELLDVLKRINPSKKVLSTEAIMYLAQVKWKEIRLPMYLQSGLYWIVFALIVCRVFDYGNAVGVAAVLLLLNSALFLVALCQIKTVDRADVKSDIWLVTDLLRSVFTYAWAVIPHHVWLAFPTIALNAFIGLTTLKAIDRTRILVQMILKVCIRTVPFVIIFIYSILSFGTLYAVTEEEKALNFYESWTTVFEMIMGNFDNSEVSTLRWFVFFTASVVNVIWLLNLIVALLGTHYDRFQSQIQSEDIKLQFELIYQVQSMINFLSKAKSWLSTKCKCKERRIGPEYHQIEPPSHPMSYLSLIIEKSQDEETQNELVVVGMIERLEQQLDEMRREYRVSFQQVMEAIRRVNDQNPSIHLANQP